MNRVLPNARRPIFSLGAKTIQLHGKLALGIVGEREMSNILGRGRKVQVVTPLSMRFMSTEISSLVEKQVVPKNRVKTIDLLKDSHAAYNGVKVDIKEPMDPNVFRSLLRSSISQWRQQGKKGVWIKLPIELVKLVEVAVKEGFWYHHAEPTYLMLVYWIPKTAHTLPANASHQVRIGAFVMNNEGEVLVVQEMTSRLKRKGGWKLPTGVVDEGEDICVAAIREVKEETGIETEFVEVLAFKQSHKSFFGKSSFSFVCMLKPLSFDIHKQDTEIAAAKWMPVEEFAASRLVRKNKSSNYLAKICLAKKDNNYKGISAVPTRGFSAKNNYIYFNKYDL